MPRTRHTPEIKPVAEEKAADPAHENAAKAEQAAQEATAAVEKFALGAVGEIARLGREAQAAAFDDARAAFSALETMTRAENLADAAQIHIDFFSGRARANVERAKAVASYLANALTGRRAPSGQGGAKV